MNSPRIAYILLWFPEPTQTFILDEVNTLLDEATSSVYISNAYVVPVDFYQKFNDLRERGVEIHLSTNSLSSNDVWVVYSGWINYRGDLIDRSRSPASAAPWSAHRSSSTGAQPTEPCYWRCSIILNSAPVRSTRAG